VCVCRRGMDGRTPVHVAAYSSTVAVLDHLVSAGGDLRLHDSAGRSARDWAAARPSSRQRGKVLDYLNKAKLTALNSSTRDFLELSTRHKYVHNTSDSALLTIVCVYKLYLLTYTHTHIRLTALFPGLPG